MDTGAEHITDADELAAVRRQARKVRWLVIATATVLTTLYVVLVQPAPLR